MQSTTSKFFQNFPYDNDVVAVAAVGAQMLRTYPLDSDKLRSGNYAQGVSVGDDFLSFTPACFLTDSYKVTDFARKNIAHVDSLLKQEGFQVPVFDVSHSDAERLGVELTLYSYLPVIDSYVCALASDFTGDTYTLQGAAILKDQDLPSDILTRHDLPSRSERDAPPARRLVGLVDSYEVSGARLLTLDNNAAFSLGMVSFVAFDIHGEEGLRDRFNNGSVSLVVKMMGQDHVFDFVKKSFFPHGAMAFNYDGCPPTHYVMLGFGKQGGFFAARLSGGEFIDYIIPVESIEDMAVFGHLPLIVCPSLASGLPFRPFDLEDGLVSFSKDEDRAEIKVFRRAGRDAAAIECAQGEEGRQ